MPYGADNGLSPGTVQMQLDIIGGYLQVRCFIDIEEETAIDAEGFTSEFQTLLTYKPQKS